MLNNTPVDLFCCPEATLVSGEEQSQKWDSFLLSTPDGQFQQSSGWARVKAKSGWKNSRVHLYRDGVLVGGFSLLWRTSRAGRIGYISKGPVLSDKTTENIERALQALKAVASQLSLRAVVVQPPDFGFDVDDALRSRGLSPEPFSRVVDATLFLKLGNSVGDVENRFSKSVRRNIRKALTAGTKIRVAGAEELPLFFNLLEATCARQHTRPNPASSEQLNDVWKQLSPTSALRLAFAECQGRTVAGSLTLGFGERATLWKIGWDGTCAENYPNELLTLSEILWASESGYRFCDFGAIDRAVAERLIDGTLKNREEVPGRYRFLLQFGGEPALLPVARFYSPTRLLRLAHRMLANFPSVLHRLGRFKTSPING